MEATGGDVTQLLGELGAGKAQAAEELLPLVYNELRALAERNLRQERPDHTLQATALVHEAYIRLVDSDRIKLRNRAHFFALASQAIRRILVDHARHHNRRKRSGDRGRISLDEAPMLSVEPDVNVLALDEALQRLAEDEPRCAQVVEMRFFGGMTMGQVAELLGLSVATIERDWRVARAWLYRALRKGDTAPIRRPDNASRTEEAAGENCRGRI